MERGVVIVDAAAATADDEDGDVGEGMWMPGGRRGVNEPDGEEEEIGGKRIQYFRPERTAFQALLLLVFTICINCAFCFGKGRRR